MSTVTNTKGSSKELSSRIDAYLHTVGSYDVLTAEEELELIGKVRAGDEEARDKFILSNLRWVLHLVKEHVAQHALSPYLTMGDAISQANVGLIMAVDKYDPERGARFFTYAKYWILRELRRGINRAIPVRVPDHASMDLYRFQRSFDEVKAEGLEPSVDNLLDRIQFVNEKDKNSNHKRKKIQSLLNKSATDGDRGVVQVVELTLELEEALLKSNKEICRFGVNEETGYEHYKSILKTMLSEVLSERESTILKHRYGLDDTPPLTLREIAEILDTSYQVIQHIEPKAVRKLQKAFKDYDYDPLFDNPRLN